MPKASFLRYFYTDQTCGWCTDLGLLIARVAFGAMMAYHGWGKLSGFAKMAEGFYDPIGLGSRTALALAVFAEFFCAILVAAGLMTRLAAIPLIATMSVAAFAFHRTDAFPTKEKALLYLAAWVLILLTGPGRYSADHLLGRPR